MECKVPNCERTKIRAKGMCAVHYERARRNNGDALADGWAAYHQRRIEAAEAKRAVQEEAGKKCKVCGKTKPLSEYYIRSQDNQHYTYCKKCHRDKMDAINLQNRINNPPESKYRTKAEIGPCAFNGCDRVSKATLKGGPAGFYCKAHYNQWHRTQTLWPLNTARHSYINERFRRCTTCGRVKTHEEFHLRTGGNGRQTECKACKVMRNRFNALLSKGMVEDAVAVYESMPRELQDKLKHRLEEAA